MHKLEYLIKWRIAFGQPNNKSPFIFDQVLLSIDFKIGRLFIGLKSMTSVCFLDYALAMGCWSNMCVCSCKGVHC